ncbi:MAG: CBS domain-containing protein [Nitrososphaerota archaeon]|nr:CBS domain-containing protein [Nitrososphaerota archaeon]
MLLVKDALSAILRRAVPTVEQGTLVAVAGMLLDIPRRDVLLIASTEGGIRHLTQGQKWVAFAGYPLLEKMLATEPKDLYKFLFQPCENASLLLGSISSESDLTSVLESFYRTRFGYAMVESADSFGIVTLTDILLLLEQGRLDTDLRVRDVASSPVFSLPGGTSFREALHEMMRRRVRRVRIEGSDRFVSDREVLMYIFSPARLRMVRKSSEVMLDATLEEAGYTEAIRVDDDMKLGEASAIIKPGSGNCLTMEGEGLVTPWDLVMKPWRTGRLHAGGGVDP